VPASDGAFAGFASHAAGFSNEGRVAFASGDSGAKDMLTETPEDRTYYSCGRQSPVNLDPALLMGRARERATYQQGRIKRRILKPDAFKTRVYVIC
jgi:hypothetical protein